MNDHLFRRFSSDLFTTRTVLITSPRQTKPPKDLTERIFWEASFYEELRNSKGQFDKENHKKRVQLIKERLEEAKKDNWLRPAMSCFVTVGSTQFDALIANVCSEQAIDALKRRGISSMVVQTGAGQYRPPGCQQSDVTTLLHGIPVHFYRFKDDILEDMRNANIIIGHAGAGTCLEALRLSKVAFIVINEDLMDNHQKELAERLAELDHVICTTPTKLVKALKTADVSRLKPFLPCDLSNVVRYMDRILGIVDNL